MLSSSPKVPLSFEVSLRIGSFAFLLLVIGNLAAHAQSLPLACGSDAIQFKVKLDRKAPVPENAPANKARLVLLQELDGDFGAAPVSRYAVDGDWVGAEKGGSYLVVDVTPGAHELCASRQSSIRLEKDNLSTTKMTLKPGETYYYSFRIKRSVTGSPEMRVDGRGVPGASMTAKDAPTLDTAELLPLEANRGAALVRSLPQAAATAK